MITIHPLESLDETLDSLSTKGWSPMSTISLPYDLTDAIAGADDPAGRAAVIVSLVCELYDTVGWVLASQSQNATELTSLRRVVDEARSHQERILHPQF